MARIRVTLELLDPELVCMNPGQTTETFDAEGVVVFTFNENGEKEQVGTRAIGRVNHGGMAQGLTNLPFGHSVISRALLYGMLGSDESPNEQDPTEPAANGPDDPMPDSPSFESLLKNLGYKV